MKKLAEASDRLKGQEMFQILERVKELEKQGEKIFHFELGDPGFRSPDVAFEAICKSIQDGETHYTNSSGVPDLRKEVVEFVEKNKRFKTNEKQILITPGANIQIFYAAACIANSGDEIIVPDPAFVSYFSILDFLDIKIIRVPLLEENNFRLNPSDVEKAITDKTKMIIINSPSNPTGSVMTTEEIKEIYEIAKKHDLFLVSDEIYGNIVYNGNYPFSAGQLDNCQERVIIIDGLSKRYAMTGWRIGFMIAPENLIRKMALLLETTSSCVSPFIQRAAIAVLRKDEAISLNNVQKLKKRRDVLVEGLNSLPGVKCLNPEGAFYAFPNIKGTGMTGREFCEFMLEKARVAISPGDVFGKYGEDYVRLSYSKISEEDIKKAVDKMKAVLEKSIKNSQIKNKE